MAERKMLVRSTAALLTVAFLAGLVYLARFSPSTEYPAYSSLQSGPSGTKLLFDALARTHKVQVDRDYLPLGEAQIRDAAVFYLGIEPHALQTAPDTLLEKFEKIARAGNRVVLAVANAQRKSAAKKQPAKPTAMNALSKRWGVHVSAEPAVSFSAIRDWNTVANTPAIERTFGSGTVVLLPSAAELNNENLASSSAARDLAIQLIGDHRHVVFEEAHLGILETGSIMGLVRRYHLQGLLASLLVIALLLIWNRAWIFPPPSPSERIGLSRVSASDSRETFRQLLARHIAPPQLIELCIAEWNRTQSENGKLATKPLSHDPVVAYKQIQEQLQTRKFTPL